MKSNNSKNIINFGIDTGFVDLAGNPIHSGDLISEPSFQRKNNMQPGIVEVDRDGDLIVSSHSFNKKSIIIRRLNKKIAANCLVLGVDHFERD